MSPEYYNHEVVILYLLMQGGEVSMQIRTEFMKLKKYKIT